MRVHRRDRRPSPDQAVSIAPDASSFHRRWRQHDTLIKQIAQDDVELQKRKDTLPNVFATKFDPLEVFVFVAKFALLIVLFFLVNILVSVYRYSQRLAAQ
jgi:hypothetical protein